MMLPEEAGDRRNYGLEPRKPPVLGHPATEQCPSTSQLMAGVGGILAITLQTSHHYRDTVTGIYPLEYGIIHCLLHTYQLTVQALELQTLHEVFFPHQQISINEKTK